MKKTALITGISGQDGYYLANFLNQKGYRVIGLKRRDESITALGHSNIEYIVGDLLDMDALAPAILDIQPDEIYNLAAQSSPSESWQRSIETTQVNGLGAHALFDLVKKFSPKSKIFQASTSEMYGQASHSPQNEQTSFNPKNPYAVAKVYAHQMAGVYRQGLGLFISCGILFNHESPYRGPLFITQKISYAAACLKNKIQNSNICNEKGEPVVKNSKLYLGNLSAQKDWGFAGDFVEAMWLSLQQEKPEDYVIGTGKLHSVEELCEIAFSYVDLDFREYVTVDKDLIRPVETGPLVADITKAKNLLGWQPKKSFEQMIRDMVEQHLQHLKMEDRK